MLFYSLFQKIFLRNLIFWLIIYKYSFVFIFNLDEQVLYIPVYFINETEEINEIVQQLKDEYYQSTGEQVILITIEKKYSNLSWY